MIRQLITINIIITVTGFRFNNISQRQYNTKKYESHHKFYMSSHSLEDSPGSGARTGVDEDN